MIYRVWQKNGSIDEINNVKLIEYCIDSGFYHFFTDGRILLAAFPKDEINAIGRKGQ